MGSYKPGGLKPRGREAILHASLTASELPGFPASTFTLVSEIYIYYYGVTPIVIIVFKKGMAA
jgi:hypothetical protein